MSTLTTTTRTVRPDTLNTMVCDRGCEGVTVRVNVGALPRTVTLVRADRLQVGDVVVNPTPWDSRVLVWERVRSTDAYGDLVEYNRSTLKASALVALVVAGWT